MLTALLARMGCQYLSPKDHGKGSPIIMKSWLTTRTVLSAYFKLSRCTLSLLEISEAVFKMQPRIWISWTRFSRRGIWFTARNWNITISSKKWTSWGSTEMWWPMFKRWGTITKVLRCSKSSSRPLGWKRPRNQSRLTFSIWIKINHQHRAIRANNQILRFRKMAAEKSGSSWMTP